MKKGQTSKDIESVDKGVIERYRINKDVRAVEDPGEVSEQV